TAKQTAALWQDPAMAATIQSILGGEGAAGADAVAAMQDRYGLALPGFIGSALKMAEQQADIGQKRSTAAENTPKVRDARLADLGRSADNFVDNPSMDQYLSLAFKRDSAIRAGLFSQGELPALPNPRTAAPDDLIDAARQITATTRDLRSQIAERGAKTK